MKGKADARKNVHDTEPLHKDKGDFRKVTFTLAPEVYKQLIQESARRKIAGEPNQLLSALLREAVSDYLKKPER